MQNRSTYPEGIDTNLKKALYDNLGTSVELTLAVYEALECNAQEDWRNLPARRKRLMQAVKRAGNFDDEALNNIMGIISANDEF